MKWPTWLKRPTWPRWLKRTPPITWAEMLESKPMPPCGDKQKHYWWKVSNGMACPKCAANRTAAKQRQDCEALASLIAEKVLSGLKKEQM